MQTFAPSTSSNLSLYCGSIFENRSICTCRFSKFDQSIFENRSFTKFLASIFETNRFSKLLVTDPVRSDVTKTGSRPTGGIARWDTHTNCMPSVRKADRLYYPRHKKIVERQIIHVQVEASSIHHPRRCRSRQESTISFSPRLREQLQTMDYGRCRSRDALASWRSSPATSG